MKKKKMETKNMIEKNTYICPICGEEHKDEMNCPVVINKLRKIKQEYQSNIMGGILLECLDCGVDFIQTLKEIVYFVENGTKSDGAKFFDVDLFVSYFAATLGCSPSKFSKRMKELPERFKDILDYADITDITPSVDENNQIESIDMALEGDFGPFWEMVNSEDGISIGLPRISVYILKEMEDKKPIYHIRLLYLFDDECFHKEKVHYSTYSCEIYSEREGQLKDYFEDNCDWTKIAKEIPCTFTEAANCMYELKKATRNGLLRWDSENWKNCIYRRTTFGQLNIELRIAIDATPNEEMKGTHIKGFGDYICIRENDIKMFHYGAANEYQYIGGPNDTDEEIIEDSIIRSLNDTIDEWSAKKEKAFIAKCNRRVIKKSDILSVTYSFVCSNNGHIVIPYRGVVSILTPEGELIEENVYLGRCNTCGVYYIFRRDYDELCKKGQPMCKVMDASTGKVLSDSNFTFNGSSILSEMGYNVQAAVNMTSAERQEILRTAIEQKKVSVNEILNLLELQIRLHSDRENYSNAVEKWKEDAGFVKSYGINSERIKRMTDEE